MSEATSVGSAPLAGVRVLEVGDTIGVSVAGFLLRELGAEVEKVSSRGRLNTDRSRIVNRDKSYVESPSDPILVDVVLIDRSSHHSTVDQALEAAPVVIRVDETPGELEDLAPSETMLAEAASGIMWLQLGHRDGPFALASPVAGLGAGILGALGAVCGLLRNRRGVATKWESDVDYAKGALLFQSLSASFIVDADPSVAAKPRYRDPYTVSFSPLMRFHRAKDGWVFIATVSRHMWQTLFNLMGRDDLREDEKLQASLPFNIEDQSQGEELARLVGEFVKQRSVEECVQLMVENKIVAAPVLSVDEFLRHPQAAANGLLVAHHDEFGAQTQVGKFLSFANVGDGNSRRLSDIGESDPPLAGIRLLDVSRAAAGPICGRVLADLGAEVARVEDPQGDSSRRVGLTFSVNNRNKLSLGLDIKNPEGNAVLRRLTGAVDVVLTNALPEASARLGIDWASASATNPDVNHVSLLGFGRKPPFGGRRVVDAAAQALSGQALAEGGGGEPVGCTGGLLDNGAGWLAALGVVALLYRQQTTGVCGSVESSLLNTSAFIQLLRACDPARVRSPRLDQDRLGYSSFQRIYQLHDAWICVCATSLQQRDSFESVLSGWEVLNGATLSSTDDARLSLNVAAILSSKSLDDVTSDFSAHGFRDWTVCNTLEICARSDDELFVHVEQPPWGHLLQPLEMPVFSGQRSSFTIGASEAPGANDGRILDWIGLSEDEHELLISCGALNREPVKVTFTASSV